METKEEVIDNALRALNNVNPEKELDEEVILSRVYDSGINSKWISVKDRLPKFDEKVQLWYETELDELVWTVGHLKSITKDSEGEEQIWYNTIGDSMGNWTQLINCVIFWAPIPEPPNKQ